MVFARIIPVRIFSEFEKIIVPTHIFYCNSAACSKYFHTFAEAS